MPPEPTPGFIDLNILPSQFRPQQISGRSRLLGTVAVVLLVLAVAGAVVWQRSGAEVRRLQAALPKAKTELAALRTPQADLVALTEVLDDRLKRIAAVEALGPDVISDGRDWSQIIAAMKQYDRERIMLRVLEQRPIELAVEGVARTQDDVLLYARQLDQSGIFERVQIESMQDSGAPYPTRALFVPIATGEQPGGGTPQPQSTPTLLPTAGAQPTQALYDAFETDDVDASTISVGLAQRHNFNPDTDVDRVMFTGRAGRRYCILALPEGIAVDPVLEVTVGGVTFSNDNCSPATLQACQCPSGSSAAMLAALVEIQISSTADQPVQVRVTSQGAAGPEAWYSLRVYEAAGSAPVGQGDQYEPDDAAPKSIGIGEEQQHTFHIAGDVDRVEFAARAGVSYQVRTLALSSGVDTVLSVLAGGFVFHNDDATPGDPSSMVQVTPSQDGLVSVSITNKGTFGANQGYRLLVSEQVATATPAASATPTLLAATSTPQCGDIYEPDDSVARPLAPSVPQVRNFCPTGDVDRAVFTAKAGHAYRVETLALAPGVDTVLVVNLGSQSFAHDDRSATDKGSLLGQVFNANSGDTPAYVTVTNKGLYGQDKTYTLQVVDLGVSDAYEPDTPNGVELRVGQPQARTFFPDGDVDMVYFMAAAGRSYRIYTSGLSAGVDTVLSVSINGSTSTNDDRQSGDLSSSVEFQNSQPNSVRMLATITNKGSFSPQQRYSIHIEVLGDGDRYEQDDVNGVPITVGSYQFRTFYPSGDIDRVYFTAQAYHRYRIWTSNLASSVDTVLAVSMGTTYLTNDDRAAGDRASEVTLENAGSSNALASVTITNKLSYGTASSYEIHVEDLGAGSGDAYEPDLTQKRYINVSEVQRHTFHPAGDVDQVYLPVQAGKRYAVLTCGGSSLPAGIINSTVLFDPVALACSPLVPGIDPVIMVIGPIGNCEPSGCLNDDATTDPNYSNARVEFQAMVNGEAMIRVYNHGAFNPGMIYYLRAHEVSSALTPTPTRTPISGPTPTSIATSWVYPGPLTATPTATSIFAPTATRTSTTGPSPTNTRTLTPSVTPTPTLTAIPSATATRTPDPYPVVFLRALPDSVQPAADLARDALRTWQPLPGDEIAWQAAPVGADVEHAIAFKLVLRFRELAP